jgi:hypothetical protein
MIQAVVDEAIKRRDIIECVEHFVRLIRESNRRPEDVEYAFSALRNALRATASDENAQAIICGFCKRQQSEVRALVTSSDSAICDECIWGALETVSARAVPMSIAARPLASWFGRAVRRPVQTLYRAWWGERITKR